MIFYFSGTGNSYWAAKTLADALGEDLTDLAAAMRAGETSYTLARGEKLGFVFPVYAWAPPQIVLDFVRKLELYYTGDPYLFAVCTCGASAGKTMDFLERALEENGLTLDSGFSIVMPDNCVTLFPAESAESCAKKLAAAEKTIANIIRAVRLNWSDFFRVKRGRGAGVLSHAVNPIFCKHSMRTEPFYVLDRCIGCGLCAAVCTSGCIEMIAGRPVWTAERCNMCLACLNRCPATAIQYGKHTEKRGRYIHPIYQPQEKDR